MGPRDARLVVDEAGDRVILMNGLCDEQIEREVKRKKEEGKSAELVTISFENSEENCSNLVAWVKREWPSETNLWLAAAAMFASCRWPISVTTAPLRDCVPFVLVSVAAWIVFPMVCGRLRESRRTVAIAHSLELMMAEVKERRVAIDFARRLRHDQRHYVRWGLSPQWI